MCACVCSSIRDVCKHGYDLNSLAGTCLLMGDTETDISVESRAQRVVKFETVEFNFICSVTSPK